MIAILNISPVKTRYKYLSPLSNVIEFNSIVDCLLNFSHQQYSRDYKSMVWEYIDSAISADEDVGLFDDNFYKTLDLSIDILMEDLIELIKIQTGINIDDVNIVSVFFISEFGDIAIDIEK